MHIRAKCVGRLAFDVDRAEHGISRLIEHRHNNLRPGGAERRDVTGIGGDIPDVNRSPVRHRHASQALGDWECRILGRPPAPLQTTFLTSLPARSTSYSPTQRYPPQLLRRSATNFSDA